MVRRRQGAQRPVRGARFPRSWSKEANTVTTHVPNASLVVRSYRCILMDNRGCGFSGRPTEQVAYSIAQYADVRLPASS